MGTSLLGLKGAKVCVCSLSTLENKAHQTRDVIRLYISERPDACSLPYSQPQACASILLLTTMSGNHIYLY